MPPISNDWAPALATEYKKTTIESYLNLSDRNMPHVRFFRRATTYSTHFISHRFPM